MKYTNEQLLKYSKPLSETEKKQCESSIRVFEKIIQDYGFTVTKIKYESTDDELDYGFHISKEGLTFTVLLQGSFGNSTCVRQDSDIDIAMICESTFRGKYPIGKSGANYGFTTSSFSITKFKNELLNFINSYYEYNAINHNKCIDFVGNDSSRKDIDIVPSLRFRDYSKDYYCDETNYVKGVLIKCNDGSEIINYPEQSHDNSITKNNNTNYYYKKIVRILKNIKHDMEDEGYLDAKKVSSYGLECIIYNVPNFYFSGNSMSDMVLKITEYLLNNCDNICSFKESNECLKIFDNQNNNADIYKSFIKKIYAYVRESYDKKTN